MATNPTEQDLFKMGLVPDGKGGFRPKTKEEKAASVPKTVGEVKDKPNKSRYFYGMQIDDIIRKHSGGPAGIYIPGNVPSSKNGRGLMRVHSIIKEKPFMMATGTIIPNPMTKEYRRDTADFWKKYAPVFRRMIEIKKPPYTVVFFLIRPRHNHWDYINVIQILQDLMQEYGWIENDSNDILIPSFEEGCGYDPQFPGVIIKVK